MAADKSKRGAGDSDRERETRRQSAAAGAPTQRTTRASGETRSRDRERQIGVTREGGETTGRGSAEDNARVARSLLDMWNDRAFDQLAGLAADDVECVHVPFATTYRGPNGYREYMQSWATAFPDGRVEVQHVIADEHGAAVEYTGRGTQTGPLATPIGTIPATGRAGELELCDVFEIEQGKVRRVRSYFDSATLMRQLGVLDRLAGGQSTAASRARTEEG